MLSRIHKINIELNEPSVSEQTPRTSGKVLQPRTYCNDDIRFFRASVRCRRAGDSYGAHITRVFPQQASLTRLSLTGRDFVFPYKIAQLFFRLRIKHTTAGNKEGSFCFGDYIRSSLKFGFFPAVTAEWNEYVY